MEKGGGVGFDFRLTLYTSHIVNWNGLFHLICDPPPLKKTKNVGGGVHQSRCPNVGGGHRKRVQKRREGGVNENGYENTKMEGGAPKRVGTWKTKKSRGGGVTEKGRKTKKSRGVSWGEYVGGCHQNRCENVGGGALKRVGRQKI